MVSPSLQPAAGPFGGQCKTLSPPHLLHRLRDHSAEGISMKLSKLVRPSKIIQVGHSRAILAMALILDFSRLLFVPGRKSGHDEGLGKG